MRNIIEYITESVVNRFVVIIKTHYSEGGYFIDEKDFEYKIIKSDGEWANEGSNEHKKLVKTIEKLNNNSDVWVVWGDPKDTKSNIKKIMEDPNTIKQWNDTQAQDAINLINNQ